MTVAHFLQRAAFEYPVGDTKASVRDYIWRTAIGFIAYTGDDCFAKTIGFAFSKSESLLHWVYIERNAQWVKMRRALEALLKHYGDVREP